MYCLKFGKDVDFENSNPTPTASLGNFVKFSQVIGNLVAVAYKTSDGITNIGLFKSDNYYVIEDQFEINSPFGYSILEETNQVL